MSDSAATTPSGRSAFERARRHPFALAMAGAPAVIAGLTSLLDHLEQAKKIGNALGYQLGGLLALVIVLGSLWLRRAEVIGAAEKAEIREREDRAERARKAERDLWERESELDRRAFFDLGVRQQEALAGVQTAMSSLTIKIEDAVKRLDEATGKMPRLKGLG